MASLMILNPRPRRTRRRATSKRRRKMTPLQLKYFGPRRARKVAARKTKARKAPARRKAKPEVLIVSQNPRRGSAVAKKRRSRHRRKGIFARNPRKAHRKRHYRRNPRIPGGSLLNNSLIPGAIGAAGALTVDMVMASVPMPAAFKSGAFVPVVKIAASLLLGMAVGAAWNREAGEEVAAGGIIVTFYGMARNFMLTRMPNVPLGRYVPMGRNVRPAMPQRVLRRYVPMNGVMPQLPGGAMTGGLGGMGWTSPARVGAGLPQQPRGTMRYLATR